MDVRIFTKWFRLRGSEVAVVLVEKRGAHLCLVTNAWQAVDWDCIILQVGPTLLSTWDDWMGVKLSKKNVDGGRFGSYIGPNFLIPCRKRLYSLTKAVEPPFHINPISTYQNIGKSDFHIARRLFILTRPSCGPSPKLISVFDHHKKSVAILDTQPKKASVGSFTSHKSTAFHLSEFSPFGCWISVRLSSAEMAGGSFGPAGVAKERAEQYKGKVTLYVILACLVAAVGGAIFGYDIGISGNILLNWVWTINSGEKAQ